MRCHIFDLDHTLLRANCSYHFGKFLSKRGLFPFWKALFSSCIYLLYQRGNWISAKQAHQWIASLCLSKLLLREIQTCVKHFLKQSFHFLLNSSLVKILQSSQERGEYVLLLSNSPSFLVGPIAQKLGIFHWYATNYRWNENRFSHVSSICEGEEKVRRVIQFAKKHQLSVETMTAYTDSDRDLPLLELVGTPIAVDPTPPLYSICRERQWQILISSSSR